MCICSIVGRFKFITFCGLILSICLLPILIAGNWKLGASIKAELEFPTIQDEIDNKPKKSYAYYLNEIEEGGRAVTYTNTKGINYPIVEVLADAYVRKANELLK